MLVTLASVLRLADDCALYGGNAFGGKSWLFDTRSGRHFKLNDIGYAALDLCDGKRTVGALVDACLGQLEVDRETLSQDIVAFLQQCADADVVRAADEAGEAG